MKKYTLLFLFFSLMNYSQIINFPDANFKNALVNTICVGNDIGSPFNPNADADLNNDGEIEVSEAAQVQILIIDQQNISDLTGISNFTNLKSISVGLNSLTALDFSNFLYLERVRCNNNQLTSLIFDNNPQLYQVICNSNNLTTLDFSTTTMAALDCSGNPNLTFLNIKNGVYAPCMYDPIPPLLLSDIGLRVDLNVDFICQDPNETTSSPTCSFNLQNINASNYCTFTPGGGYNTITGNIAFDCANQNENLYNIKLNITDGINSGITYSNTDGNYVFYPSLGNHTITPILENPSYFQVSPTNVNYTFSSTGNNQTANFCLTPNGVHPDLEIVLFPILNARPGFNSSYLLLLKNKGTQVQSGTVTFNYDDTIFDYIVANPSFSTSNTGSISWDFTNLQLFETRMYTVTLNLNGPTETPAVNIDDVLHFTSSITTAETDETPNNNTFNFNQTVVGSFDPNDKTCVEGNEIALADINKPLHYIIRFQNTGSAAAENVVVKDILNSKLDLNSLQITSSSHPFRSTLTQNNKLEFFFENINLPASSLDEPGSHGYIAFSIKPKNTVVVDDVITNSASIYFDYNYPIITNTTSTTIRLLATNEFEEKNAFTIYPNPANEVLNIQSNKSQLISKVEIYNMMGQMMYRTEKTTPINVSGLPTGTYFVSIFSDKGKSTQKFIKL
jgi:uncharacterized repeat protein (TIGR01451 family)